MKKTILLLTLLLAPSAASLHSETRPDEAPTPIQKIEQWYEQHMNYYTITALMAVESSFLPFPSEIVVPPAAYVASKPGSSLNIYLIVLFATLGSIIGAYVNYFLALWLGRPAIYRFADSKIGRLLLLNREKLQQSEAYFKRHGNISTFIGRLIPVIRQLISIPAGLARINLLHFSLYTILGAAIWNIILVILGCAAHGQADLINKYSHEIGYGLAALLLLLLLYWTVRKKLKSKK